MNVYSYLFVWVFIFTAFFIVNSLLINEEKNKKQIPYTTPKIYTLTVIPRMTGWLYILLEELDLTNN